jgi:hypothetical protein
MSDILDKLNILKENLKVLDKQIPFYEFRKPTFKESTESIGY